MQSTASFLKCFIVSSAILLFFPAISLAQDHAPTVEQCRADQRLWSEQFDSRPEEVSKLSFRKLIVRGKEMTDCAVVDEEQIRAYNRTADSVQVEAGSRLLNFVTRHNLMAQFIAEDNAGKR